MTDYGYRKARNRYNGWKNRETWNVALWIGNDEPLYRRAVDYARHAETPTYTEFVKLVMGLAWRGADTQTPDGVLWLDPTLDYPRLDEMIKELRED